MKEAHEKELVVIGQKNKERMYDFGRKMNIHFDDEAYRYDAIEEEFGMNFICKVKLEEYIEHELEEREYLVNKL